MSVPTPSEMFATCTFSVKAASAFPREFQDDSADTSKRHPCHLKMPGVSSQGDTGDVPPDPLTHSLTHQKISVRAPLSTSRCPMSEGSLILRICNNFHLPEPVGTELDWSRNLQVYQSATALSQEKRQRVWGLMQYGRVTHSCPCLRDGHDSQLRNLVRDEDRTERVVETACPTYQSTGEIDDWANDKTAKTTRGGVR